MKSRATALLSILGLSLLCHPGCAREPATHSERLAACKEETCRAEVITAAFHEGGAPLANRLLDELRSPIERISVVMALSEAAPGQTGTLCDTLSERSAQSRCRHLNRRPHLQTPPPDEVHGDRVADGPADSQLQASGWDPDIDVVDPGDPCTEEPDPTGCLTRLATRAMGSGDVDKAYAVCEEADGDKWQDECRFMAAELAMKRSDEDSYAVSSELCATAGRYRARCQDHLLTRLAQQGPDVTSPPEHWAEAIAWGTMVKQAWSTRSAEYGEVLVDRYWALTLNAAYQGATGPGRPPVTLPEEARPHLHGEVSRLVVLAARPGEDTLKVLVSRATKALKSSVPGQTPPDLHSPIVGTDLWRNDRPDEVAVEAVSWRGFSRRTRSTVTSEDLAICILEAAAREGTAWTGMLETATGHPARPVAWTAQRLLERQAEAPAPGPSPE